jgi:hypothetical protein
LLERRVRETLQRGALAPPISSRQRSGACITKTGRSGQHSRGSRYPARLAPVRCAALWRRSSPMGRVVPSRRSWFPGRTETVPADAVFIAADVCADPRGEARSAPLGPRANSRGWHASEELAITAASPNLGRYIWCSPVRQLPRISAMAFRPWGPERARRAALADIRGLSQERVRLSWRIPPAKTSRSLAEGFERSAALTTPQLATPLRRRAERLRRWAGVVAGSRTLAAGISRQAGGTSAVARPALTVAGRYARKARHRR